MTEDNNKPNGWLKKIENTGKLLTIDENQAIFFRKKQANGCSKEKVNASLDLVFITTKKQIAYKSLTELVYMTKINTTVSPLNLCKSKIVQSKHTYHVQT